MRQTGIEAVYPRQNTGRPNPENQVYPYLLQNPVIAPPDHVWSIDITCIPVRTSRLYLTAILDWFSGYVLSREIADTLDSGFVLEACRKALAKAVPEIMNSDQGSHFASPKYTQLLPDAGSRISMDHRGRACDNIFIERLWRTVKYGNVYPREYGTPKEARIRIDELPSELLRRKPLTAGLSTLASFLGKESSQYGPIVHIGQKGQDQTYF